MRTRAGLAALALLIAVLGVSSAGAASPQRLPVVAVIDSGLNPKHAEFSYAGPASAKDQIVAWWDFTADKKGIEQLPQAGQLWDTKVRDPYDNHGHGTGTASMAVGRNRKPAKLASLAPGFPLVVAKVLDSKNGLKGDLGAAIRWARFTAKADIINISVGTFIPVPGSLAADTFAALKAAHDSGAVITASNGNGLSPFSLTLGVVTGPNTPGGIGWTQGSSGSEHVLAVGTSDANRTTYSLDPEVTGPAQDVTVAWGTGRDVYAVKSGTSFAAPYVAGAAARIKQAVPQATPGRIEQLLKLTAVGHDDIPPMFEGFGAITPASLAAASKHALARTTPTRPSPDTDAIYVDQINGAERHLWTGLLPGA